LTLQQFDVLITFVFAFFLLIFWVIGWPVMALGLFVGCIALRLVLQLRFVAKVRSGVQVSSGPEAMLASMGINLHKHKNTRLLTAFAKWQVKSAVGRCGSWSAGLPGI
jgi:hypothetical protein